MPEPLPRLKNPLLLRRLLGLLVLLALLIGFRHLALLGVSFVIFTRALGWLGGCLARLLRIDERRGLFGVLLLLLGVLALAVWGSVRAGNRYYLHFLEVHAGQSLTDMVADLQTVLLQRLPSWVPLADLKERAPEWLQPAVVYLRSVGRVLLQLLIGLILAIVYLLDRAPVDALLASVPDNSVAGSVRRYFGYIREAVLITVGLQVLVAVVNTALTLPVIVALRLPHLGTFVAIIFFSSLVPVIGNLVSGAVLIVASYVYRGITAVVLFVGTTFLLHKIEAYYLNPRLTSRHVKLPALALIVSLILFEHVFGLIGLFLSFPSLYVGIKTFQDLRAAQDPIALPPA